MVEEKSVVLILAENQRLETERLCLRPINLNDTYAMFDYASDERTSLFVFPRHESLTMTKEAIATYFLSAPLGKYAIELKRSQQMIGTIELRVEQTHKRGEIGYVLHHDYWGNGYMPEAVEAILSLAFEAIGLIRVFATHDIDNPQSGRVMEKVGMKLEGMVPNARVTKGKIVTDQLRGMTIEDWKQRRDEKK